jgi:hypothetical protein
MKFLFLIKNLQITSKRETIGLAINAINANAGCIIPPQIKSVITIFIRQNNFRPYSPK